jgi:PAS domain S-box-containing protein
MDPLSLVHPDDRAMVRERMVPHADNKETISVYECRLVTKDNRIIFVNIMGTLIPYEGRLAISGNLVDMTERKLAEEEERLTRKRFETLLNVSEMRDTSELELTEYVMQAACRMTESTLAFIGTMTSDESVMELISWSEQTMQNCRVATSPIHFPIEKAGIWADAVRTRKPKIVNDYVAPHPGKKGLPEGHVRITRFLSLPILDNGRVVMVAAVANKSFDYDDADVTRLMLLMQGVWANLERRRSEKALIESEQKFRDIFNNTTDAIHIHTIRDDGTPGRFTEFNDVICRILGYTKEELLTKTPLDITTEYHNPPVEKILEAQRTTGVARFETGYRRKDGMIMPVEVNTHVVTIQGTEVMLGVVRDITERKQVEESLRQTNKKLNLLSSITRHDINNQLMALEGCIQLCENAVDNPFKLQNYIEIEQKIVDTIIHQIAFTKDYEDMGIKAPTWKNVHAIIDNVTTMLPIQNICIYAGDLTLEIFADPLLDKVFYNLIDNALHYGGDQMTEIRISHRDTNGNLVIIVEDDGTGISAEEKEELFTKGFGKHTGLGLFLSREILSITGITIIETGEHGKGARFEILVPKGGYRFAGTT